MMYPTILELLIAGALFAVVLVLLYSLVCLYFMWLEWKHQRENDDFIASEIALMIMKQAANTLEKGSHVGVEFSPEQKDIIAEMLVNSSPKVVK